VSLKKKKMKKIRGKTKVKLVFLIVIILSFTFIVVIAKQVQDIRQRAATTTLDYTQYVNLIQSSGRQVFMRYPLGRIGLWSLTDGEVADSVTRNIRLYPVVDQTGGKDNADWRITITAKHAQTDMRYNNISLTY